MAESKHAAEGKGSKAAFVVLRHSAFEGNRHHYAVIAIESGRDAALAALKRESEEEVAEWRARWDAAAPWGAAAEAKRALSEQAEGKVGADVVVQLHVGDADATIVFAADYAPTPEVGGGAALWSVTYVVAKHDAVSS